MKLRIATVGLIAAVVSTAFVSLDGQTGQQADPNFQPAVASAVFNVRTPTALLR